MNIELNKKIKKIRFYCLSCNKEIILNDVMIVSKPSLYSGRNRISDIEEFISLEKEDYQIIFVPILDIKELVYEEELVLV